MNRESKLKNILLNIAYVVLPVIAILYLIRFNNATYQAHKEIAIAKAILAMMIYIFILKKVQLFNWISLAFTMILIPLHFWNRGRFIESEDLVIFFDIAIWSQWLAVMIGIDIVRTFDKRRLRNIHIPTMVFYLLMFVAMWICSNTRKEPLVLIFPLLLWIMVPVKKEERINLIYRLCDAFFLSFIYVMIRSFIENPYSGGRYYGYFVNIGAFGIFIGAVYAAAIFRAIDFKRRFGIKSIQFALSAVWLAMIAYTTWLVNTRTLLLGIGLNLVLFFIFGFERENRKSIKIRSLIVALLAAAGVVLTVVAAFMCKGLRSNSWIKKANEWGGIKGKAAYIIAHLSSLWDDNTVFDSGVLKVGSFANVIDKLSSGRVTICKLFLDKVTFFGCIGDGVQAGTYYAFNAHNTYVHYLYIYGILGGTVMIGWFIYTFILVTKKWRKTRQAEVLFAFCLLTTVIGMMFGEVITYYYGAMFFTLMSLKFLFYKEEE